MTVVQPNSIAGINSITALDDKITFHKSDGSSAGLTFNNTNFSNTTGVSTFANINITGAASTISANGNATFSGIITAANFVGDGSGLSNVGVDTSNVSGSTLNIAGVSTFNDTINLDGTVSSSNSVITFDNIGGSAGFIQINGDAQRLRLKGTGSAGAVESITLQLNTNAEGGSTQHALVAQQNSSVKIYNSGNEKLETTGFGITIFGTTQTQTLNVSGVSTSTGGLKVGTAATIYANGNLTAGIGTFSAIDLQTGPFNVGTAATISANGNVTAGIVTTQNVTISSGAIDLKNSGSVSNIKFYCESSNAHYTALQSAAHSAYSGNVTLTLPATTDTLVARTTTDTLTNKTLTAPSVTGNLSVDSDIVHTGDTDTKIAFTDNQIDIQANGSSRLYINQYAAYVQTGYPFAFLASSGDSPSIKSGGTNNQDLLLTTGTSNPTRLQITSAGISSFSTTPRDDLGSLRDIPLRSVTGSAATLVVGDAGKVVSTNTTGWTVPGSTFDEGDTVTLLNNSAGGLTITCSAVTTYLTSDGTTVTSSTLGARGLATLYFVSSSVAYLQGTSLS